MLQCGLDCRIPCNSSCSAQDRLRLEQDRLRLETSDFLVATRLRVHQVFRRFFPGFLAVVLSIFFVVQPNGAILSEVSGVANTKLHYICKTMLVNIQVS